MLCLCALPLLPRGLLASPLLLLASTGPFLVANLEQTFSRLGTFDPDAVSSVPLRAAKPWLDNPFSDNEISAAVRKLANGKSAGEAQCPVGHFKALEEDAGTKVYLREVVNAYWE